MNKKALLIVDVQIRLFNQKKPLYNPELLLQQVNTLEKKAREAGIPIVYIQHENLTTFKYGDEAWHLHPDLKPGKQDIYIRKKECNSFFETPLHSILQEQGIDTVIVCGLLTPLCVMHTCLGARELNYKTILVSDAHSNTSIKPEAAIKKTNNKLAKSGVTLIPTNEIDFT